VGLGVLLLERAAGFSPPPPHSKNQKCLLPQAHPKDKTKAVCASRKAKARSANDLGVVMLENVQR
jgi:hypothetical protein